MAAYRKLSELGERSNVRALLTGIARSTALAARKDIDLRRKILGPPTVVDPFGVVTPSRSEDTPQGATWVESVTTGKQHPPPLEVTVVLPGIEARARMLAQLEGALGAAITATPPGAARLFGLKLALGASVLLGGAGLFLQGQESDAGQTAAARVVLPAAQAPAALPPPMAPRAMEPTSASTRARAPNRPERAPVRPRRPVRIEAHGDRALLESAQRTLSTRPGHALELTAQHRHAYPDSRQAEQRELIAIEALRVLGRTDTARERARSFEQSFPGTESRARLLRALGPE